MPATVFVCGMNKKNGNPIVSFDDKEFWQHKCTVFEVCLPHTNSLLRKLKLIQYNPGDFKEETLFFIGRVHLHSEFPVQLMKDLLKSETCFIIYPGSETMDDEFKLMLKKLKTNLEWVSNVNFKDDNDIYMDLRVAPRHVLFLQLPYQ